MNSEFTLDNLISRIEKGNFNSNELEFIRDGLCQNHLTRKPIIIKGINLYEVVSSATLAKQFAQISIGSPDLLESRIQAKTFQDRLTEFSAWLFKHMAAEPEQEKRHADAQPTRPVAPNKPAVTETPAEARAAAAEYERDELRERLAPSDQSMEQQRVEIIAAELAKGHQNLLALPYGHKVDLRNRLCSEMPRLFTPSTFEKAWTAGTSCENPRFRLANADKHQPGQK